jgi:tryptophanyl-tRNA synthetase
MNNQPETLDEAIEQRIAQCKRDCAEEMYEMLDTISTNMHRTGEGTIEDILSIETLLAKARGEL